MMNLGPKGVAGETGRTGPLGPQGMPGICFKIFLIAFACKLNCFSSRR